jgi:hypothetical protein
MHLLSFLLNPAIFGLIALFSSVIWMLMDEKDKTRPLLVFALTLNLIFGTLLTIFMAREGALLPWKYDHVLLRVDESLGLSAASIALPLQGRCRIPLAVVYQALVPMMIFWFLVNRYFNPRRSVVLAYAAELVAGPLLYAVLPACGPAYAFGAQWLHPPEVLATTFRLSAMPNAFPSLHIATALIFALFAPGKIWRGVSLTFLALTALAVLSTGEHYVIDLVAGLAVGCFAASVGKRAIRGALFYFGVALAWSLAVRFAFPLLIACPALTRTLAAFTVMLAALAIIKEWRMPVTAASSPPG